MLGSRRWPVVKDTGKRVTYLGTSNSSVEHFQNIFYAESTSGRNRFAPPIPRNVKNGTTIDATAPGAWCPQGTGDILPFTSVVEVISEDCLSLRIARPAGTPQGAKLPVAVWIHGGKLLVNAMRWSCRTRVFHSIFRAS